MAVRLALEWDDRWSREAYSAVAIALEATAILRAATAAGMQFAHARKPEHSETMRGAHRRGS